MHFYFHDAGDHPDIVLRCVLSAQPNARVATERNAGATAYPRRGACPSVGHRFHSRQTSGQHYGFGLIYLGRAASGDPIG